MHNFPYGSVKQDSIIILYGVGNVGTTYINELVKNDYCKIKFALDKKIKGEVKGIAVHKPDYITEHNDGYDYLVIANANYRIANEIKSELIKLGVDEQKIVWDYTCSYGATYSATKESDTCAAINSVMMHSNGKKIILYGTGRGILDFLYVYSDLEVAYCVFDGNSEEPKHLRILVEDKKAFDRIDKSGYYVIVAEQIENFNGDFFEKLGLEYALNWCYVSDWVKSLDLPVNFFEKKQNIVICGKQSISEEERFLDYYGEGKIAEGLKSNRVVIAGAEELALLKPEKDSLVLLGAVNEQIEQYLLGKGFEYGKNFVEWNSFENLPSRLFVEMSRALPADVERCTKMDTYAEYAGRYDIFCEVLCCPAHLKTYDIGRIDIQSPKIVWNSNIAKVSRLCTVNRTYECCTDICPFIVKHKNAINVRKCGRDRIVCESDYYAEIPKNPKNVSINIDYSCNLNCRFCRPTKWCAVGKERDKMYTIAEQLEQEVLPDVDIINMAGDGEVFFSPVYQKMLYDSRNKGKVLRLVSNGTLLDRADWKKLAAIYSELKLCVSIGTFSKDIYEDYWKGASWENTKKNIEYAGYLRKKGVLKHIQIYYLVTTETYKDLPDFIEWAEENAIDMISLNRLHVGGEFRDELFDRLTLFDSAGDMKQEYRGFFQKDIFNHPIINWGNIK